MGEAKRRRETDSTFGKVPKNAAQRGIVINPGVRSLGQTGFSVDLTGLDPLLRRCLLYWDRINWPDNNLVSIGGGPDVDFLLSTGVLQRTHIRYSGGFSGDLTPVFAQGQLKTFEMLNRNEPGLWSIAQDAETLTFADQDLPSKRALEVSLYNALPVVADTVPYADILEFREKYRPELLQLRQHMDGLYENLLSAEDTQRTYVSLLDQLALSLNEIERALIGMKLPSYRSSCSLEIKLDELILKSSYGAAFAGILGVPSPLGVAVGAAVAVCKLEVVKNPTPEAAIEDGPFAYLFKSRSELI